MAKSLLDGFIQDLRYTGRTLRRDAGFTAFAILIVGLGIGASTTVFSVVDALLARPLPFRDPASLLWITNRDTAGLSEQTTQVGYVLDLRARSQSFTDIAGYFAFYGVGDNLLSGGGEPERLSGVPVTENFFQVLGVQPQIGRLFTPEECKWHGPKAVLLGHGLWTRRFGSDPTIAGRTLTINDEPVMVAGVLPASFDFASVFAPGSHFDLYFPFPLSAETNRWGNTMAMIGRLKPGVSQGAAAAELRVIARQIVEAHPERNGFEGHIAPLAEHVSGRVRPALTVLAGAVGVVMLIVCANLSNLLLARTATRQKEIAIRTALGAGRGRLVRQMFTEGIALACCGAVLGIALAVFGTRLLSRLDSMNIPLLASVRTDWTALGFTLAATLLTGVVFGLAPAFTARMSGLAGALKDATRGSSGGREGNALRGGLVVAEIAFACVLLVGTGLLARSLVKVLDVDLGFRPDGAAAIRVDPDSHYSTKEQRNAYYSDVLRRVRAIPGVEAAALSDTLPLGRNRTWGAGAKGRAYPKGQYPLAFPRIVSDGYLAALGVPLRDGRDLSERDTPETEPVIVVNETLARTVFPGENALGKILRACGERRIVGIVGDVRHLALEQESGSEMYLPMRQCADIPSVDLVVRTKGAPEALAGAIRASLRPIAPNLPGKDFRTLRSLVDRAVSPRRFTVLLLGGFAVFALLLSSAGIYAVVSYGVDQRRQEIGIRLALGASAGGVQRAIVRRTLMLAGVGVLIGTAGSWALARGLGGMLYGVRPDDTGTFGAMALLLAAIAGIAGYVPARRASRLDPSMALRAD